MNYEEKYKEALEVMRQWIAPCHTKEQLDTLKKSVFPELAESEDEKIRKAIINGIQECQDAGSIFGTIITKAGITYLDVYAWLEKQKENPKSADSISSDCTSDAKCEDRWHKVTDSLPDNGRLVLAKDCLGNVLLARYDGENWEVNVYDNEDHYCYNSISKWCEIPSEKQKDLTTENIYKHSMERMSFWNGKQKEQKPVESISQQTVQGKGVYKICPRCKERMVRDDSMVYTSMPPQYRYECPKCGESECDTVMYDNPEMEEQKPAEWSEEENEPNIIGISPERLKELRDKSFEDGRKAGVAEMAKSMPMPEDTVLFQNGVKEGRRLEREDLPKWREMPPGYEVRRANVCTIAVDILDVNGKCCGQIGRTVLQNGNEYLFLDDLEKLPREK